MRRGESAGGSRVRWFAAAMMLLLGACAAPAAPDPVTPQAATLGIVEGPTAGDPMPTSVVVPPADPGGARCEAPAEALPALTEGPYFKVGSPERTALIEPGTAGTKLVLNGFVFNTQCVPIAGARLDFWQADGNGVYDNTGFGLRGHQFTDAAGSYSLTTVVPGVYPGRTEHIHFKVQAPGGATITSQLFFPGSEGNETDRIFDPRLLVHMEPTTDGWTGTFDFVVEGS